MFENLFKPKKQNQKIYDPNDKSLKATLYFMRFYIIAAVAVLLLSPIIGYSISENETRTGIDYFGAISSFMDNSFSVKGWLDSYSALFSNDEYTKKGVLICFVAAFGILFVGFCSPKKRFHRKGVEHGSARWGTDEEKSIIRDNVDFFNNAIIASDVFLVIDRKKRDLNEQGEKKKNNRQGNRYQKAVENVRLNSPTGTEQIVVDKKGELKQYISLSTDIIIPENFNGTAVTKIADYAFTRCEGAENITLPKTVKKIGKYSFFGLANLRTVHAESVESIDISAFEGCERLDRIFFSDSLKSVKKYAFEKCSVLEIHGTKGSYAESCAAENYLFFVNDGTKEKKEDNKPSLSSKQVINSAKAAKKIKPMLNLNMIVLGGSGTGKSRFFVKPNLMQLNTSFVVTDPSGELLASCGKMLQRHGYKVKIFNIENMSHSDNYNPFVYLKEHGSDKPYKPENVIKMVKTFLVNTKGEGESGDPFWDNATEILLTAVIFFILETQEEDKWNWATVLDYVHMARVDKDKKTKSEFDLLFDDYTEFCELNHINSQAVKAYTEFNQAAGETMQSILINTTARLKNFKLDEVINLTSSDTIGLDKLGDEKTALFIIIPSTDTTYNYLAAMMYTQLFDTLYGVAIHSPKGRLDIPVRCILDEFANVGKIPEFDKVLATCRKFEISAVVILQNLSQLKRIYEKSWEELPGNCDTMLYLGGKDQFTNEYIMKSLGKETIDLVSQNKSKGKQGSTSYNDSILGRELLQQNELEVMDNNDCIVMIRGLNPFLTAKFDITNHVNYGELSEVNMEKNYYDILDKGTNEAIEIVDSFEFIDNNEYDPNDNKDIDMKFIASDNTEIKTMEQIKSENGITAEGERKFEELIHGSRSDSAA